MHKVRLVMSGPGRGELFIDDKAIKGVTSVDLHVGVDEISKLSVQMNVVETEVEGIFDVTTIASESRTYENRSRLNDSH